MSPRISGSEGHPDIAGPSAPPESGGGGGGARETEPGFFFSLDLITADGRGGSGSHTLQFVFGCDVVLGAVGFYRIWIPGFSEIAKPLFKATVGLVRTT